MKSKTRKTHKGVKLQGPAILGFNPLLRYNYMSNFPPLWRLWCMFGSTTRCLWPSFSFQEDRSPVTSIHLLISVRINKMHADESRNQNAVGVYKEKKNERERERERVGNFQTNILQGRNAIRGRLKFPPVTVTFCAHWLSTWNTVIHDL